MIIHIFIIFVLVSTQFFSGCASAPIKKPLSPPYDPVSVKDIIASIQEQNKKVDSFFSIGQLTSEKNRSKNTADFLIVGVDNPLKLKIEITHQWGKPLFHFLIDRYQVNTLSFREKRLIKEPILKSGTSSFFPINMDVERLWGILKGYPALEKYHTASSLRGGQITLFDSKKNPVQVLEFDGDNPDPVLTVYPDSGLKISFQDYENNGLLRYSKNIVIDDADNGIILNLSIKTAAFNETIPEPVFELHIPHGFKR